MNFLNNRLIFKVLVVLYVLTVNISCSKSQSNQVSNTPPLVTLPFATDVSYWLTNADTSALLKLQKQSLIFATATNQYPTITVDTTQIYQTIDGFGFALTGGSSYLINLLQATEKTALLRELFTADSSAIGIDYLRISIGASDLSLSVYTYDDLPSGQTDTTLKNFDFGTDKTDLIPLLQQIVALAPNIKIIATPWTAPSWMKSNNSPVGGNLNPSYYKAYAQYFVKYIQVMQALGIRIEAITPQNEPLNPSNNPSMLMSATEELNFVKNYLGPQFIAAGLTTKIVVYDHNCDQPSYPLTILGDTSTIKYVDGSAFHLYAGDISALSTVHNGYPSKNVYFTEQWVGAPSNFASDLNWHVNNLIIGATRNWSKNVLEWNLASDPSYNPHTPGGCSTCLGALTIGGSVSRNVSYYIIAHASKFVSQGSVRVSSNLITNLANVAFQRPDGKKVLIVINNSAGYQTFNIQFNNKIVTTSLAAGALATYLW